MKKLKVYLGCSLTHSTLEYRQMIHGLIVNLKQDFQLLEFESDPLNYNPDDMSVIHQIYEQDTGCVKTCDFMVAECSYPSLGLGFEMGTAIAHDKPLLAIAKEGQQVTRLVLGITHPKFVFARYNNSEEVGELVNNFVEKSF